MRIRALYKQPGKADWAKSRERERKADRSQRDNCLGKKRETWKRTSGRTALLRSQIALKGHGSSAGRAEDFGSGLLLRLRRTGRLLNRSKHRLAKAGLQGNQLASDGSAEEAVVAHLHKSMRENVLEETLKELLD